mmetsp:Transcript_125882/g.187889  ORF Transcript_125882/g.187889 Transcript_125882/m.187889 type:complete len:549 (+) Transcript_125882:152-1798(+)
MTIATSLSSVSEASSPSTLLSESSSSSFADHHTMAGAGSLPTSSSSISSEDSPTSVADMNSSVANGSIASSEAPTLGTMSICTRSTSAEPDLSRIHELEQKRLALRHQRFSLEQRLYEFCGKHVDGTGPPLPCRHVMDMPWKDKASGNRLMYSGPVNDQDEPHGNDGLMKFSDGQVYRGDVRNGLRCGAGVNSWGDGQEYNGEWKQNSRNGRGTHTWRDGRRVCGQWQEGHLNGKVYFSWPNGATYDGMVLKGKKHGRGVHTWADGRVYSGHFENGKESGFGTLTHPDGVKYRGQFKQGVKEGYGIMLWKTRTYDGEWINNKPHGQGRVVWSNGATYTGQFFEGKYHGLGVYVWATGKKFVGRWEHGVKNGHGLYQWPTGKKYDGEYKNGLKDGYGRMTWPDGQSYCGGFERNKRSGRGVQTAADGSMVYCGQWKDDHPMEPSREQKGQNPLSTVPKDVAIETGFDMEPENSKMIQTRKKCQRPGEASVEARISMTVDISKIEKDVDETQYDICAPDMTADSDEESCKFSRYGETSLVKQIAPSRLVV